MITFEQDRLTELLKQQGHGAACERCIAALAAAQQSISVGRSVPIHDFRANHELRAELNRTRNGDAEGFDELIPALQREEDYQIAVHSFTYDGRWFRVMTNLDVTRLLGVLTAPLCVPPSWANTHSV